MYTVERTRNYNYTMQVYIVINYHDYCINLEREIAAFKLYIFLKVLWLRELEHEKTWWEWKEDEF